MMTGVITRLMPGKGYGFVRGNDRVSRFFHCRDVIPSEAFDTMHVGQAVEFEAVTIPKGARALQVTLK